MKDKVYFITTNSFKKEEASHFFAASKFELQVVDIPIQEIMHLKLDVIVRDKLLKAYKAFGLPCAVEHGALHIDALNELPGGISKVVWDSIEDKICGLIAAGEPRGATAKSVVGYCDGKKIYLFEGETRGSISEKAIGDRKFQWDPIFIPEGTDKTYAQLGFPEKQHFSQGTKAWKQLIEFISKAS